MHATYNENSDRLTIHDLDKDQYGTLLTVFSFIGGHRNNSPRKHIDDIDNAISEAMGNDALDHEDTVAYCLIDRDYGASIYFKDYSDIEKQQALAKLTEREKELLGLI